MKNGNIAGNKMTIQDREMMIKEYNGQRVVTFKDIDNVHKRVIGTARRTFTNNRKHFIEGVDYFKICMDEIRSGKITGISPKIRNITLFTESGYLMLVKSFTDDLAWSVQRQLVNGYFRAKEMFQDNYADMQFPISNTIIPKNANWFARNNRRMKRICENMQISRKPLYHQILSRLGEQYDLAAANKIYEEELGFSPQYAIDIVIYFSQLANKADEILDDIERSLTLE